MKPYCAICLERDRTDDLALLASAGGDVYGARVLPVVESYVHRDCHRHAVRALKPFDFPGDWPHRPLLAGPVPDDT